MLFRINESLYDKLESVLRTAACLVLQKRNFDLISTDICHKLHHSSKNKFKICVLVYRCLPGTAPDYIAEMMTPRLLMICCTGKLELLFRR